MYSDLVYATPGLTTGKIKDFYKDNTFGVEPGRVERTYSPPLRPGVTIVRDSDFGVPHVYGDTRADVMYGAGYVNAEDRLFMMDALRHAGRANLSAFAGGSNKAMDVGQWQFAPYNEADLQLQFDLADDVYGAEGARLQQDVQAYVDGINGYIIEARVDPNKMPVEYAAIGKPLENWTVTDPLATASLIGGIFGKGGGNEVGNALVKQAAISRFGSSRGVKVFEDFRRAEDPEAPTTVHGTRFPYQRPGRVSPSAVAEPDPGSLFDPEGSQGESGGGSPAAGPALGGLLGPLSDLRGASNALLVSGQHTTTGRPLAVFGPQVSYFIPQILMEQELHCVGSCQGGLDIDSAGATFPGVGLYTLLGRGPDFAWSATSAGQDIVDTFAEELCEPDGSAPTVNSMHYRWKGQCRAMEVLERTNVVTPNAADPCGGAGQTPCGPYTIRAERTVHGIAYKRGTVRGKPVAFVRQRSSYFHEADSARAFAEVNSPLVQNAQQFQQAMYKMNLTFNWFYADDRDIAYFNSGDNPVRADGTSMSLPNWGTGSYDWRNFDEELRTSDVTPFAEHPQTVNQSYITSWNNKQAPAYRAADDNYSYGPLHRSIPLDDRILADINGGGKMSLAELIDAMEDAGTVDLRGGKVLPLLLQVVGSPSDPALADAVSRLQAWVGAGAHRRDANRDGQYEHARAIEIMDAWWPRLLDAQFKPALGAELFNAINAMIDTDDEPNSSGAHVGSAYIEGWYGYVQKDLRRLLGQSVRGAFSRVYCGSGDLSRCRDALRTSLAAAVAASPADTYDENPGDNDAAPEPDRVARCPAASSDQWCFDSVASRALGAITVPTFHWINRPTWQQAIEVQGHRPR